MTGRRILVAGIGNVLLGDDGFGVAAVRTLARRSLPEGVVVMDAGIRGLDLTYALMDGCDAAILLDASARGGAPGTLYVLDPDGAGPTAQSSTSAAPVSEPSAGIDLDAPALVDAHGMDPVRVLSFLRAAGAGPGALRVVACEPESFDDDGEPRMGLSAVVEAAVEPACDLVESILRDFRKMASMSGGSDGLRRGDDA